MKKLFTQYHGTLMSFFSKRLQNAWDAEELTQEVFLKLLRRKDAITGSSCPESYLYTVAWSVLRDKSRRDKARHRDKHLPLSEEHDWEDDISPEQVISGDQLYRRYLVALDELSPKARAVFILHRYDGLSYAQIADYCGVSASAVEKHMMKAIARMKELLKELLKEEE